jgi:hypothetical protein
MEMCPRGCMCDVEDDMGRAEIAWLVSLHELCVMLRMTV